MSWNSHRSLVPEPTVMPIDRQKWAGQLNLSNFINTYYQYRDLQECPGARKVLIIGPGQGVDTQILKWRGYDITTFDIDTTFNPDVTGSVHDLSMFCHSQFDVVIASHVLEHLAVPYLDRSIAELARVARWALVYLPVAGRHFQTRFSPGFKGIDCSLLLDLFNWFERPDGVIPKYCGGQHYWEIGMRGFRVSDMERRFCQYFRVVNSYRNRDWNPSYNFILESNGNP